MKRYTVYLSGPMSFCTPDQAIIWRRQFTDRIGDVVECLSPIRGEEQSFIPGQRVDPSKPISAGMRTDAGILSRDYFDTQRADVVVQYLLGAEVVSIGTMMEMAWAFSQHTPIVTIDRGLGVHDHPMVRAALDYRASSIGEAVSIVRTILNLD